mmetsp:Transcript_41820/g.110752  ORF Transcript_41820/g.110752 Transcript_41820/m.110752 type:complete len:210 (+) Transcript_41820:482-1111(+)
MTVCLCGRPRRRFAGIQPRVSRSPSDLLEQLLLEVLHRSRGCVGKLPREVRSHLHLTLGQHGGELLCQASLQVVHSALARCCQLLLGQPEHVHVAAQDRHFVAQLGPHQVEVIPDAFQHLLASSTCKTAELGVDDASELLQCAVYRTKIVGEPSDILSDSLQRLRAFHFIVELRAQGGLKVSDPTEHSLLEIRHCCRELAVEGLQVVPR